MRKQAEKKFREVAAVVSLMLFSLFAPSFAHAQTIAQVASFIKSPVDLAQWFAKDFKYEGEFPDNWQSPENTLNSKKGDCDDFATLAQEILSRKGIKSDIIIIKFNGISQMHAVCMFKNGRYYSFISNQELVNTRATTVVAAIQEQYSDWESIAFSTAKKQVLRVIMKDNFTTQPPENIETASLER